MTAIETTQLVINEPTRRVWVYTVTTECTAARHNTLRARKVDGCCCPIAARLGNTYEKRRRCGGIRPNRDSVGSMRRLQALAVDGWPSPLLAKRIGINEVTVSNIRRGMTSLVYGSNADRIAAVYDELTGKSGPSDRTRAYAARKQWLPYTAWSDDIDDAAALPLVVEGPPCQLLLENVRDIDLRAIERAMSGHPVTLTRRERREAIARLYAAGKSYSEMADLLAIDDRMVHRDLQALGVVGHREPETAATG